MACLYMLRPVFLCKGDTFCMVKRIFSLTGLFDWKKDKKSFARFEETLSPEREFIVDDSELFSSFPSFIPPFSPNSP